MIDDPKTAEAKRVEALLERDRAEAERDHDRRIARGLMASGNFSRIAETALEPTPEWLAKGNTVPFTPKQPNGTVRVVKTVRRVATSVVDRLHQHGKMTDEQAAACRWYNHTWLVAGLDGRCAASQWNPNSTIRRGDFDAGFGYIAAAEAIAEARQQFRMAVQVIPSGKLKFFDDVVLMDQPLRLARKQIRIRNGEEVGVLRGIAESLATLCDHHGFSIPNYPGA